jgi:Fe-S cluster biogenesis protein NfuA
MDEIRVHIQPTPNPSALKFIVNRTVKSEGKATFVRPEEGQHVRLAADLFEIPGVSQLHFFDNFITVTFNDEIDPSRVEKQIESVIITRMLAHDPNFKTAGEMPKIERQLSRELLQVEEIFDRTIRPGLRADGGDIEALSLEGNVLTVNYQGACGTCPSSAMGTLEAIRGILAAEFNPDIEVNIA